MGPDQPKPRLAMTSWIPVTEKMPETGVPVIVHGIL